MSSIGFCCVSRPQRKGEKEKIWTHTSNFRKNEKVLEHEKNSGNNSSRSSWNSCQELRKETGWTGDQRKNWNHSNHSNAKINSNTLKSVGDPLKLAVIETPMKNHLFTLEWKARINNFITSSMESWRMELAPIEQSLEVKIQRGIVR